MIFQNANRHDIRVVTNVLEASAEKIAEMYQVRWTVEVFFRWLKQYLNVPTGNANLTMYKNDCLKLYSFSHCLRATLHGEAGMIALLGGASY
ncbi:hypothetical protein GCM10022628_25690 [Anoxybacillus suryakundensis]